MEPQRILDRHNYLEKEDDCSYSCCFLQISPLTRLQQEFVPVYDPLSLWILALRGNSEVIQRLSGISDNQSLCERLRSNTANFQEETQF